MKQIIFYCKQNLYTYWFYNLFITINNSWNWNIAAFNNSYRTLIIIYILVLINVLLDVQFKTYVDGLYVCSCGIFFMKSLIKENFQSISESGQTMCTDVWSWLSVISGRAEYTKLCLPEYCDNIKLCLFVILA